MAAPGPAIVGADGFARFDVTPEAGATQIWVEIEEPSLDPADVVVRMGSTTLTSSATALGTIAITPAPSGTRTFAVAITDAATPDIAVTVVGAGGVVLSSASYRLTLVDYRGLVAAAPGSGFLAFSGFAAGVQLALGAIAALAIVAGAVIGRVRRTKATT